MFPANFDKKKIGFILSFGTGATGVEVSGF
jgi:hypothetical protein